MTAAVLAFPAAAAAQNIVDIVGEIEQNGYYVEPVSNDEAALAAAVEEAQQAGVAFVWLDNSGGAAEATTLAEDIWNALDARGSRFNVVLVLLDAGYNAWGPASLDAATMERALDDALAGFGDEAEGEGLSAFANTISGAAVGASGSGSTPTTTGSSGSSNTGTGGGISLSSLLLPILVLGGGFWLFRNWSRSRKEDAEAKADMEADRAEIKEQLRDNADRVIDLGDRVVLSADNELIDTYEKASRTYQDVSQSVDGATTAEHVDELDDRIDQAEWELAMIEAKLDGRPVPPSPAEIEAEEARAAKEKADEEAARRAEENSRPALGRDESVVRSGSRQRSSYPRSSYPTGYGRRRGGFGGMGGGLGGILGSIVLGQMQRRQRSRRTQRRTSSFPGGFGSGGRSGGLGGGVLRPGGSSSRSGGGRSIGGGGKGGGGRRI